MYIALFPSDEFERQWSQLMSQYPSASKYLDEELYPCRARWAWAWISNVFTADVRTTGRVEGENRINKAIGGPKKTFLQLFDGLNQRTEDQTAKDLIQVRQVGQTCLSFASLPHSFSVLTSAARVESGISLCWTIENTP